MKKLKFALITVFTLLALGAAGVALSLRAPSSAEICANQIKVVSAELQQRKLPNSPSLIKELMGSTPERCEHDLEFRRSTSTRAPMKVAAELRCLASATTLSELDACR